MDVIAFSLVGAIAAFIGAWLVIVADQPRPASPEQFWQDFYSTLLAAAVTTPTSIVMGIAIVSESETKLADTIVSSAVFVSVGLVIGVVHLNTSVMRLWTWIVAAGIAVDYALLTLAWLHIGVEGNWMFATPAHFQGAAMTAIVLTVVTGLLLTVFAGIYLRSGKHLNVGPRERHERATAVLLVVVFVALVLALGSFPARASDSRSQIAADSTW